MTIDLVMQSAEWHQGIEGPIQWNTINAGKT